MDPKIIGVTILIILAVGFFIADWANDRPKERSKKNARTKKSK